MKICVGVRGSIAAYRSPDFIRELLAAGHEVEVVLSKAARNFVTDISISTFTGKPVKSNNPFDCDHQGTEHIALSRWADCFIIYGATANFLGKCANGLADDFMSLQLLATKTPVIMAAAMNPQMWSHPAVQDNVNKLKQQQVHFAGPVSGTVACGETGVGHVAENTEILTTLNRIFPSPAANSQKILISAGPMRTSIDPARYIQNQSSGKMGLAFARAIKQQQLQPTIILGPVDRAIENQFAELNVKIHRYKTVNEYQTLLEKLWPKHDCFISLAAVLDFTVNCSSKKLERHKLPKEKLELSIQPTQDFVAWACANKTASQKVIAFGMQDGDEETILAQARKKMHKKNCDVLIANPIWPGLGANSDRNLLWILQRDNDKTIKLGPESKDILARSVVKWLLDLIQKNKKTIAPSTESSSLNA